MFTFSFAEQSKMPLYEQLYLYLKQNIQRGFFKEEEKLPSKRKLANHLNVSISTVENAYYQLIAEGYLEAREKKGYFVKKIEQLNKVKKIPLLPTKQVPTAKKQYLYDLKTNAVDIENFPFSVWAKLLRNSLKEEQQTLLAPVHPQGDLRLRQEIVKYLQSFRNIQADPEQVVLGAGTEYLLGLLVELLAEPVFALENPCYHKPVKMLQSKKVAYYPIDLDKEGLRVDKLNQTATSVALVTPSRHFPLGTVMTANRRLELLNWANKAKGRFIIEDDYDSEYRYFLKAIPPLQSMDTANKVIYLNTFARTLAPSLRLAYLILPWPLLQKYQQKLNFYSCTVSEFDQCTLRRFLQEGYYERHLHRMRLIYRKKRDTFLKSLAPLKKQLKVEASEAGLHFLMTSLAGKTEKELIHTAQKHNISLEGLSSYYLQKIPETHTVIAGYGSFSLSQLEKIGQLLVQAWQ